MGLFYKQSLCFLALPIIASIFVACSDTGSSSGTSDVSYTDKNGEEVSVEVKLGSFKDSRDGKLYKTVKIGDQTWMAENLNYGENGSCYGEASSNCTTYGRLYTLSNAKTACPTGWHLPYKSEWNILTALLDKAFNNEDGRSLKSTSGWEDNNDSLSGNGLNSVGFNALPAGLYNYGYSQFYGKDKYAMFWINDNPGEDGYSQALLLEYDDKTTTISEYHQNSQLSVRCISDENSIVEKNGMCGTSNEGALAFYDSSYYTCDSSLWRTAYSSEILSGCNSSKWGDIRVYNGISYMCEDTIWREATPSEALGECDNLLLGTTKKLDNNNYICKNYTWVLASKADMAFEFCSDKLKNTIKELDSINYVCTGKDWRAFTTVEQSIGYCNKDKATGTYKEIAFTCDTTRNIWLGTFTDNRDNKSYKAIEIEGNIWMAENLNYKTEGRHCYDSLTTNCDIYGGLYTWATAMNLPKEYNDQDSAYNVSGYKDTIQGICPEGWHIPDSSAFQNLENYIEQYGTSNFISTTLWTNGKGTDLYGLNIIPSGNWYYKDDDYQDLGKFATFWSLSQESHYEYYYNLGFYHTVTTLSFSQESVSVLDNFKHNGLSLRCIKNKR